jgi:hypothetical protein
VKLPRRRWQISFGVLAVISTIGVVVFMRGLEEALRAPINDYLRDRTLALLSETEVQGLTITFPALDLRWSRRQLVIRDLKIRYEHRDSTRYVRFQASTPRIVLEGLGLSDVIWHKSLRLSAVRLEAPTVSQFRELADTAGRKSQVVEIGDEDSLRVETPALDSLVYDLVAAWLPDDFRGAHIDLIAVHDGSVVSSSVQHGDSAKDSIGTLQLQVRNIALDSLKQRVFESAELSVLTMLHLPRGRPDSVLFDSIGVRLDPKDTVITLRGMKTVPGDRGQALYLAGMRRSNRERSLRVDSVAYEPVISDDDWLRRSPGPRSRMRLNAGGIFASQVLPGNLTRQRVQIGVLEIKTFRLDLLADKRGERPPPRPRRLWPQALAQLDWKVRIDSLRVDDGLIHYGEIHPDRSDPATISFTGIKAVITGLSNGDSTGMPSNPMILEATARLAGVGPLTTRMEVPIDPTRFRMKTSGSLGSFPVAELNRFLMTSDGFRFTRGRVDSVKFDFQIAGGKSTGTLQATYDSLNIELVDKATRKRGLLEKLKGFLANNVLLRGENLPKTKGFRPSSPISYELEVGDTFWGLTWKSVRGGVKRMMHR